MVYTTLEIVNGIVVTKDDLLALLHLNPDNFDGEDLKVKFG